MYFRLIKNLIAGLFLLFTVFSILATSSLKRDQYPDAGSHYIISDCVTPTVDATIVISNGTITSPGGASFTDYGFPTATLAQTVSGTVSGATRECTVTYGEDGDNNVENRWLYSCFDNGTFKCSIFIRPN